MLVKTPTVAPTITKPKMLNEDLQERRPAGKTTSREDDRYRRQISIAGYQLMFFQTFIGNPVEFKTIFNILEIWKTTSREDNLNER